MFPTDEGVGCEDSVATDVDVEAASLLRSHILVSLTQFIAAAVTL